MPRRRYLDKAAPADATYNSIRPVYRSIQLKKKDTPQRREDEAAKARARAELARVTLANQRQASIGPYREKTAIDKAGGRLYAAGERRAKEAQDREAASDAFKALLKPISPSTAVDIYDAYKRGEVNNVIDLLAAPYATDSWSEQHPGTAAVLDIAGPAVMGKSLLVARNIANRNLFAYAYLDPIGYQNMFRRAGVVGKHILTDNKLPMDKLRASDEFWAGIKDGDFIDGVKYRDLAYRKALNLGEPIPLYLPNGDGTFRYNLNFLKNHAQFDLVDGSIALPAPKASTVARVGNDGTIYGSGIDKFTKSGGRVSIDDNVPNRVRTMYDSWEVKPFSHFLERKGPNDTYNANLVRLLGGDNSKLVRKLRTWDLMSLLGGRSFRLRTAYPYTDGIAEDLAGKLLGRRGASTRIEDIVDFSRLDNNGLLIR